MYTARATGSRRAWPQRRGKLPMRAMVLRAVRKGGRVVCAGIHMSDLPGFPYRLLWEERQLLSVANLTRQDGIEFLRLAPEIGIITKTTSYPLGQSNQALADLRAGRFEGAAVLVPWGRSKTLRIFVFAHVSCAIAEHPL